MKVMRYAEIISFLDAEIDRLQRARDLLAGSSFIQKKGAKRTVSVLRKTAKASNPEVPPSAQSDPAPVQIQRVPYKNRERIRRLGRPSKPSITSTALSSHVPQGPVVVSADEARKAEERAAEPLRDIRLTPAAKDQGSGRSLGSLIRALASREAHGRLGTL